jgi:hypothetical protein
MNSTTGLHAPCQAATANMLRDHSFNAEPAERCDSYQSAKNNHLFMPEPHAAGGLPAACAVETDAGRPFFMHFLG